MKIGVRKPSIKKSVKARTTGRAKRAVKKAVIPGYGKKGTGWIKNPKKAAYNKVYNKTTVSVGALAAGAVVASSKSGRKKRTASRGSSRGYSQVSEPTGNVIQNYDLKLKGKPSMAMPFFLIVFGVLFLIAVPVVGILLIILGLYCFFFNRRQIKKGDFATPADMNEWCSLLSGYGIETAEKFSILALANASAPIMDEGYSGLMEVYDKLDSTSSLKAADVQNLLACSGAVLSFQKYLSPKKPAIVYSDDFIASRRTEGVRKFIDGEYIKAVDYARTLKTEAGKINQAERFRKSMNEIFSETWPEYLPYVESKIDMRDFERA